MAIKLYNTLKKKKEILKSRPNKKLQLFVCGPTVYDNSHVGHARTYVAFDIMVRYLRYRGLKVFYLQNITDIDDKIISRAREKKVSCKELSRKYKKAYFNDMKALRITSVDKYAPATKYIDAILKQVRNLLKKGYAYKLKDGIYYDVSKFKDYGKLSGRTVEQAEDAVSRIDKSIGKKNRADFVLWKFSKPGEPKWKSKLGTGRPGWHIEDTAITETEFGPQYDIHGGAKDLIFPHHEAEIAQMEAASGKKPMVRYWIHTGFLNVEGKKMSKSLRNFITIRNALNKWDVDVIRLMFASTHYRSPSDYSEAAIKQAKENLEYIRTAIKARKKKADTKKWIKKFIKIMDNDFNTPKVVALLLEIAKKMNKGADLSKVIYEIGDVLGINFKPRKEKSLPAELKKLIKKREIARKKKDWKTSDKLRAKLKKKGIILEDVSGKTKWRRA